MALIWQILSAFGIVIVALGSATGEELPRAAGIEHVLFLAVGSDPASQLRTQNNAEPVMAKMTVKVQISAHSQEANFFGVVPATVADFDLIKGSKDQEIWRDGKCHHERGFPKITVTGIEGLVTSGQQKQPIAARWRKLGLFLPGDEVLASKRVGASTDNIGYYIETRTETKKSRLFVDLKLYILPCLLPPGPT